MLWLPLGARTPRVLASVVFPPRWTCQHALPDTLLVHTLLATSQLACCSPARHSFTTGTHDVHYDHQAVRAEASCTNPPCSHRTVADFANNNDEGPLLRRLLNNFPWMRRVKRVNGWPVYDSSLHQVHIKVGLLRTVRVLDVQYPSIPVCMYVGHRVYHTPPQYTQSCSRTTSSTLAATSRTPAAKWSPYK